MAGSWCTTPTATTRRPRSPSCWQAKDFAVEFVTCHDQVAPFAAETLEDALTREQLHAAGVALRSATTVTAIDEAGVDAEDEFGDPVRIAADGLCSSPSASPTMRCGARWRASPACIGWVIALRRG